MGLLLKEGAFGSSPELRKHISEHASGSYTLHTAQTLNPAQLPLKEGALGSSPELRKHIGEHASGA